MRSTRSTRSRFLRKVRRVEPGWVQGTCATEATASSCSDHPKFSRHGWCQINKDTRHVCAKKMQTSLVRCLGGILRVYLFATTLGSAPRCRSRMEIWYQGLGSTLCIWCSVLVCVIACSRCCFRCPCLVRLCCVFPCCAVLCCVVLLTCVVTRCCLAHATPVPMTFAILLPSCQSFHSRSTVAST